MQSGRPPRLVVQNLRKKFRGRDVLRDVSLTVAGHEIIGLLGPNGAGKTTVFYIISGLMRCDQGQVLFDGHDITTLPIYRRARMGIGYLPQEPSIFRNLSVADNLIAVLERFEPNADLRDETLEALLADFALEHLRGNTGASLSGGERRRVEIARCLAARPHFILLDEPFAGVDPFAIHDIRTLIATLKSRGIGVLITDHNVRTTLSLIDRGYIIHDGKVLTEGSVDDIIKHDEVRRYYLGADFTL